MKKRTVNNNGITICDSIVMSVRKKRTDVRTLTAVLIAISGYIAVIMSFLGMFSLQFSAFPLIAAAFIFSAFYITLTVISKKALWIYAASILVFAGAAYKFRRTLTLGFKFVYNVIYRQSYHTDVAYYKDLEPDDERKAVTILLIFGIWLLASVIYYFTIGRPNPILPLLVTFPVVEIGLYNGIEIPIIWGMLVIAYWLALLAMSTIDVGEYIGGTGGFVRKDDLFFPKRQMKLKVTERCGAFVIAVVMAISLGAMAYIKSTGYERSEKLDQKRRDLSTAFNEFSFNDLSASLGRIFEALGFDFMRDKSRLGSNDSISYDNEVELVAAFSDRCNGAVYLKNEHNAIYKDSKWSSLSSSAYESHAYKSAETSAIKPGEYYGLLASAIYPERNEILVTVKPKSENPEYYVPYGTLNRGSLGYKEDAVTIDSSAAEQTYRIAYMSSTDVLDSLSYTPSTIYSFDDTYNAVKSYGGFDSFTAYYGEPVDSVEQREYNYRGFVYSNYLQIPDTPEMKAVRKTYSDVLRGCTEHSSNKFKIATLYAIKEKMSSDTTYTLSPGRTPMSRDFVNYFLLENHKGYCVHYATSGVMLARMAGIPARYASGYVVVGSDFDNAKKDFGGSYILNIKDSRSHAWAEVYLDGFGWVPFEFTSGYSENAIQSGRQQNQNGTSTSTTTALTTTVTTTKNPAVTTSASPRQTATTLPGGSKVTTSAAYTQPTSGSSKGLPTAVKVLILAVLIIAAAVSGILIRRKMMLIKRERSFTTGTPGERIGEIYAYALSLLGILGVTKGDASYTDFADSVEEQFAGKLFEKGTFRRLMDISLGSAFSPGNASDAEISDCISTARSIASRIYEEASFKEKLSLKYFKVLY